MRCSVSCSMFSSKFTVAVHKVIQIQPKLAEYLLILLQSFYVYYASSNKCSKKITKHLKPRNSPQSLFMINKYIFYNRTVSIFYFTTTVILYCMYSYSRSNEFLTHIHEDFKTNDFEGRFHLETGVTNWSQYFTYVHTHSASWDIPGMKLLRQVIPRDSATSERRDGGITAAPVSDSLSRPVI